MYVTLEPCPMCAGALVNARVERLVFGAYDPKAGACGTLYTITEDERLNHRIHTIGGILDAECGGILKEYFQKKRKKIEN
jgi:tRNA(adenine34) deaminase